MEGGQELRALRGSIGGQVRDLTAQAYGAGGGLLLRLAPLEGDELFGERVRQACGSLRVSARLAAVRRHRFGARGVRQRCGAAGTLSIVGGFSRGWEAYQPT